MRGYSLYVAEAILNGDKDRLGVRLGRACIERNIPVTQVAGALGVTRQTIYYWFTGEYDPSEAHQPAVERYIASLD
jgi:hypothetical protein